MTLWNHSLHFTEPIYGRDPQSYSKMAENGGFEYYETRALGCTNPDDVIQLDPDLQADYPFVRDHYRRIGLKCSEQIVWDLAPKIAYDFAEQSFSVYMFADAINSVRPDPKRLQATERYLDKNSFMRRCRGKAPIPKTIFGDTAGHIADARELGFPLYVKGALSSGGSSAYRCASPQELQEALGHMHGAYQLQADVAAVSFLSVLYNITDAGEVQHLADTEQIIDGVDYVGSRYPTAYSPHLVTGAIAQQAADDGLCDKIGFDVAVNAAGVCTVLECNPRWTGALYPLLIAQKLGARQWRTVHQKVRADRLQNLNWSHLQYDPGRGTGAVLVNWGSIRNHWLEFLLIGPAVVQETLQGQLGDVFG